MLFADKESQKWLKYKRWILRRKIHVANAIKDEYRWEIILFTLHGDDLRRPAVVFRTSNAILCTVKSPWCQPKKEQFKHTWFRGYVSHYNVKWNMNYVWELRSILLRVCKYLHKKSSTLIRRFYYHIYI